jgi:hypothetical protein
MTNISLEDFGIIVTNIVFHCTYPSCQHSHTLSPTTLQGSTYGHSNICDTASGSILCGCRATDPRHMASKTLKFEIVFPYWGTNPLWYELLLSHSLRQYLKSIMQISHTQNKCQSICLLQYQQCSKHHPSTTWLLDFRSKVVSKEAWWMKESDKLY